MPIQITTRCAAAALCLALTPYADALSAEGGVHGVQYAVYAPDWTWQGRDVNIMAVFQNNGGSPIECAIEFTPPPNAATHFGRNGAPPTDDTFPIRETITVQPGETGRIALTAITALHGFPRQTYPLQIAINVDDDRILVDYPLRTIRGQAVREGLAIALGLPIAVALIFAAAFAFLLRRIAEPGAWKIVAPPVPEPDEPEPWIETTPN